MHVSRNIYGNILLPIIKTLFSFFADHNRQQQLTLKSCIKKQLKLYAFYIIDKVLEVFQIFKTLPTWPVAT